MEVINYHRPVLGTFHAKLCVIDRKIGLLQSNNVQDNDNLEMMSHIEGPIVNAMYEMLLISWHKHLNPPLPCIQNGATKVSCTVENPTPSSRNSVSGDFLILRPEQDILSECTSKDPHYDPNIYAETRRVNSQVNPRRGETRQEATARHLGMSLSLL
jgi:phosphatidylserine/phosphatidylglycerophosphate/cardiolipin synthase-like enzyme